jgi:hypothetical protein
MKRTVFALALLCLIACPCGVQADEPADADRASIKQAALDYIDGFYSSSVERMDRALHPNLQKVTLHTLPSGSTLLDFNGVKANLMEYAAAGLGAKPEDQRKIEVTILDVFNDIATVRIDSADVLDYAHLARVKGRWQIINVLWAPHRKAPGGEAKQQ